MIEREPNDCARAESARATGSLLDCSPSSPSFLHELRVCLTANIDSLTTLGEMARHLALSTRTLQRRLREAGTTFRDELCQARVRRAELLLAESDDTITHIAHVIGFSSSQNFSRRFGRISGNSPSAFRTSARRVIR